MGVAATVVFTGLCALVTGGEKAPAQVLLVDARGVGPVSGAVLPDHSPTLVVSLGSLVDPGSGDPTRVVLAWPNDGSGSPHQVGLWDLTGAEVRIRVQGALEDGVVAVEPATGTTWPSPPPDFADPAGWRDLRYVADMRSLTGDGRIRQALLEPSSGRLPQAVAARIHLESGRVEAGVPSRPTSGHVLYEFRALDGSLRSRQALSDTVRWTLEPAEAMVIEIVPASGGPAKRLVLRPSAVPHPLFISNLPAAGTAHAEHGTRDLDIAAVHFAAYYALLAQRPPDQPLPRPSRAEPPRRSTGMAGGPFCPPARFVRD
jgi:hypothetical protein